MKEEIKRAFGFVLELAEAEMHTRIQCNKDGGEFNIQHCEEDIATVKEYLIKPKSQCGLLGAMKEVEKSSKIKINREDLSSQKETLLTVIKLLSEKSKYIYTGDDPMIINLNAVIDIIENI